MVVLQKTAEDTLRVKNSYLKQKVSHLKLNLFLINMIRNSVIFKSGVILFTVDKQLKLRFSLTAAEGSGFYLQGEMLNTEICFQ